MSIRLPTASQNAVCASITARVDDGTTNPTPLVRVYSGAQPSSANDAATGDLLAQVELEVPAYGTETDGIALLAGTPLESVGLANGTPGWFRLVNRDEATVVDGSAGMEDADMLLSVDTIVSGASFFILSGSIVGPSGEAE